MFDADEFVTQLSALLKALPDRDAEVQWKPRRAKALRAEIEETIRRLEALAESLDPIRQPGAVFDPSDPDLMGRLIGDTLLEQPRVPLAGLRRFYGSGVYAIYYEGPFPTYSPLRESETPVYLGKVDPADPGAQSPEEQRDKIWHRLVRDHARNIKAVDNLDIGDFSCRYLVVKSAWQSTAELYLIDRFMPIWNKEAGVCYGIGKHGDKAATRTNTRSPWDELHPGRAFALEQPPNPKGVEGIKRDIERHFETHPPE